jgi:hypothetical protein
MAKNTRISSNSFGGLDVPLLGLSAPIRDLVRKILVFLKKLSKELNPTAEIR